LLALARFKTTASAGAWRGLKDYVSALKENQTAIYYLAGDDVARLETSPHMEGFRARGIEVLLLLPDPVDSFWVTSAPSFEGKPFKSVTQGAADLAQIPRLDAKNEPQSETDAAMATFVAFAKTTLGDAVADVRISDRLTDSAVCLVAPEHGPDRQLEATAHRRWAHRLCREANPGSESAPPAHRRARGIEPGRPCLEGGHGAPSVRRSASPRRRSPRRPAGVLRSPGASAGARAGDGVMGRLLRSVSPEVCPSSHGRPALLGVVRGGGAVFAFELGEIGARSTDLLIQSTALGIGNGAGRVLWLDPVIDECIDPWRASWCG
jgi:hypothetical protein